MERSCADRRGSVLNEMPVFCLFVYARHFAFLVVVRAGFVLMTPQLYINYKLKSVDHLPWRALIYRRVPPRRFR